MTKKATLGVLGLVLCVVLAQGSRVHAAQNAMGHYSPGSMASFIDGAPRGLVVGNIFNFYSGSGGADKTFPIGINLAADVDVTTYADVFLVAYGTLGMTIEI